MQRIKQQYFDLVRSRHFIGVQAKTLGVDNLPTLSQNKMALWYLLKYDGERRLIYVSDHNVFLIDRKNYFTHMKQWRVKYPGEMVCDGELLNQNGKPVVKVFDLMYLRENVESKPFTERLKILNEFAKAARLPDWFIVSTPYHLSNLKHHLDKDNKIMHKFMGFDVDGIVLMVDTGYYRGAFDGCFKLKNLEFNTMDLEVMSIIEDDVEFELDLGCMNFNMVELYKTVQISTDIITKFENEAHCKFDVGKIIEFQYYDNTFIPFRDRSTEKTKPNARMTVENVWDTLMNPVTPVGLIGMYQSEIMKEEINEIDEEKKKILDKKKFHKEKKERLAYLHQKRVASLQVLSQPPRQDMSMEDLTLKKIVMDSKGRTLKIDISAKEFGSGSRMKLEALLTSYLDNFDDLDNSNGQMEVEFKFGLPNSLGQYENGISMEQYEVLKTALTNDFKSEDIVKTFTTDYVYNKFNLRESIGSDGVVSCMRKTKLKLGSERFLEFNLDNTFIMRGTLSHELNVDKYNLERMIGSEEKRGYIADLARQKDRISFKCKNYSIDLTIVTNLDDHKDTAELEIELNYLTIEDLQMIFDGKDGDGLNDEYVNDILGVFKYVLMICQDGAGPKKKLKSDADTTFTRVNMEAITDNSFKGTLKKHSGKVNKALWEIMDSRPYSTKAYQDGVNELKKIVWSEPLDELRLAEEQKSSAFQLSQVYWNNIFSVNRDDGGILRGKSKKELFYAIVYIALCDIGMLLTMSDYKSKVIGTLPIRDFVKSYSIGMKYIIKSPLAVNDITLENYVEGVVRSFELLKDYRFNMNVLCDEVKKFTNNDELLKLKCSAPAVLCLYVHCKCGVALNEVMDLIHCKISKENISKSKDIMRGLISGNNIKMKEDIPEFEASELKLSLVTISSEFNEFKMVKTSTAFTTAQKKFLNKVVKAVDEISNETFQVIVANPDELVRTDLHKGIQMIKKELGDKWDSLMGENDCLKFLLYMDYLHVINFEEFFNNFNTTETFKAIRWGDKETKVYMDLECKPVRQRKAKTSSYNMFQNAMQLILTIGERDYDVKVFKNGKMNIAGCQDCNTGHKIAKMIINKINETQNATTNSDFSVKVGMDFKLPVEKYQTIKYSLLNASAKTNLHLTRTEMDMFGLKKVYNVISDKYKDLLVPENHLQLKSDQMPLCLPPPDIKAGKRIIIKINGEKDTITTIQLHSTGAISFSAKSQNDLIKAYEWMIVMLKNEIHGK